MPFPKTRDELITAGYRYDNNAKCRGCSSEMEWWITPKGGKMPFDLMQAGGSEAVTHFSTCPDAEDFRSRRIKK